MAIERNKVSTVDNIYEIEFDEIYITELFEKEIDQLISEEYTEGKIIKISLNDLPEEWIIDELVTKYTRAGWEVHYDYDESTITLI